MVPPLGGEIGAVEYIRYGPGLTKAGYYAILGTSGHMVSPFQQPVGSIKYQASQMPRRRQALSLVRGGAAFSSHGCR